MASESSALLALFFSLNLLFFALVTACGSSTCPSPRSRPANPNPNPNNPNPNNPNPNNPNPNNPNPNPNPSRGSCPRDALKLGVCADLLGGLLNVTIGTPPVTPCCTLIQGLADLEAAVCLCTVIRANILGINLNIPVSLSLLLNVCSRRAPSGFQCA
ncbi:hypothetical protein F2P56_005028 [Juglans regia]|uniref:PEARLI1-like lipid transfer protein 3 n=2 Tax=Juglans regia TaxID=51240 RepID=A0A2I4GWQ7_JUGRE|nr:pEARLI1-like lipid transfer protein 3 [Juglans regia]KAF5478470.1 hypothetical protein F2P56_005028 [Juglans regia]